MHDIFLTRQVNAHQIERKHGNCMAISAKILFADSQTDTVSEQASILSVCLNKTDPMKIRI